MKSFPVKEVLLWDGGDRHNFGFYIDPNVPDDEIKKAHRHCSIGSTVVTIFDDLDEVKQNSYKELRRKAWIKLSPQEREALGMDPNEAPR